MERRGIEPLFRPLGLRRPHFPVIHGAEGDRTPDLLHAMQAFSQLNYRPMDDRDFC